MAKVIGPLYSIGASGKIADSMVFFAWKGINVVRQWLVPSNPQSANQGNVRVSLGGTGRAVGAIGAGSEFAQQLIDLGLIPGGQTKQSYLVQYIINTFINDSTAYLAELSACTNHTSYTAFEAAADDLYITEFDLDYATVDPYDKALGVYLIARAAIALSFTGTPYTLALTAWVTASVDAMSSDFTTAA
jgi:hypothetical protein